MFDKLLDIRKSVRYNAYRTVVLDVFGRTLKGYINRSV